MQWGFGSILCVFFWGFGAVEQVFFAGSSHELNFDFAASLKRVVLAVRQTNSESLKAKWNPNNSVKELSFEMLPTSAPPKAPNPKPLYSPQTLSP